MNEFLFEETPWEATLQHLHNGDKLSATQFLTIMEGEPEEYLEDAFADMEARHIQLDPAELPMDPGSGELCQRLALEAQLVKSGNLLSGLNAEDPLRVYLEELAGIPVAGDEQLLADRAAAGDEGAATRLVELSLSRVIQLAGEMTGRGVLLLDLIQEGSMGLWKAVTSFQQGGFADYRDWYIRQYLARAVTLQARAGGLGMKMRQALENFRAADEKLLTKLGRNPSLAEIAEEMSVSLEDAGVYEDMLRTAREQKRDTEPKQEDPTEAEQAVEDTAYFQSRQRVLEMLSTLTERESHVLSMRFGLEGGTPCSAQDVARKLSLEPDEVVKLEAAALSKLRAQNQGKEE